MSRNDVSKGDALMLGYSDMTVYPRPSKIKGEYIARHHEIGTLFVRLDVLATTESGLIFAWAKLPSLQQNENSCDTCPGQTHNPVRHTDCGKQQLAVGINEIVLRADHTQKLATRVAPWAIYYPTEKGSVYAIVYGPVGAKVSFDPDNLLSAKCFSEYCTRG